MTPLPADALPNVLRRIRLRKAHVTAAASVLESLGIEVTTEQAEAVATAVLTAEDGTRSVWCVGLRAPSGEPWIFGPYGTAAAAQRAADRGLPLAGTYRVLPLIPWPRKEKP